MNCSKGFSFIFILCIILCAFHIEHLAGKKEILKEGKCYKWFEHTVEESGSVIARWSAEVTEGTCHICNPTNKKKSWLITKMVNTEGCKLLHIDANIFRRECPTCQNQNIKVYILEKDLPTGDRLKSEEILNGLPVSTTLQNKEDDKSQFHHFQFQSNSANFSIVFLSEGSCTRIKSIEASSFVCEQNVIMGVLLPRTVAPASGVTRVNVSCPENSLNLENEKAYGLCSSDGLWNIISPCMCKKGFTLAAIKEGCTECSVNTYKDNVGNGKCSACPRNSKSDTGQRQCLCKYGFYRYMGDNITRPCYGIPSAVSRIIFADKTETSITLLWEPPERRGTPDQEALYDVECKKCQSGSDSKPCEDSCGTRVLYIPRQSNLKSTSVTVQNLDQDTEYEFVIYSKNLNSLRINKSNWENSKKKIKTEVTTGLSQSDGLPAVVIGVAVIIVVMMIIIIILVICLLKRRTVRQFRRSQRLVGHQDFPLRPGKQNYTDLTTYDNPERGVSEFANNEEPHYEIPDELDIVLYEEVADLVPQDENRPAAEVEANNLHIKKLEHESKHATASDNGTEPQEEVPILTRSALAEVDEKGPGDTHKEPLLNDLVDAIPLDDETKPHEGLIMAPKERGRRNDDFLQSELLEDNAGYLLPAVGETDPSRNVQFSETSAYAQLDKNRQNGTDVENADDYQKLLKRGSDYVIPADGETDPNQNAQIMEPSAYAQLDKNRQDGTDKENVDDYQKLLKRDTGYVIPADGETDSTQNVQILEPSA